MIPWWNYDQEQTVARATTFEELVPIALAVVARMPQPLMIVCGPISTGGLGSLEANLERFEKAYQYVRTGGISVFNQLPFEGAIFRIKKTPYYSDAKLLELFYAPLFTSGYLRAAYFIPGWQESLGARWERNMCINGNIRVFDIPEERLS